MYRKAGANNSKSNKNIISNAANRLNKGSQQNRRNIGGALSNQAPSRGGIGSKQNPGNSPGQRNGSNSRLQGGVAGAVRINLDNFTSAQKNINSAVIEYLLKNGLMNTVDTMQDELINQRLGGMEKNMLFDENTGISHMLNAFDLGKREHFFISWNRFVPIQLRSGDLKCQKLEFYIHIYFAIYPALPDSGQNDKDLKRELGQFKVFLDTKGAELSQTSEFLPYYALPYVPRPTEHPHFNTLCTRKWANGLKNELSEWLNNSLPKLSSPSLFHWYANFKKKQALGGVAGSNQGYDDSEIEEVKEKFQLLQKHYVILQKKEQYAKSTLIQSQSKWTSFSREIVNISKELLFSLEAMGAKNTVNNISLLPIRQKLGNYEQFLNNNVDNLQNEHGINLNNKPTFIQSIINQQQLQQQQPNQIYVGGGQTQVNQGQYPGAGPESQMMNSINTRGDQSFDEDVGPIQQQLQGRFGYDGPNAQEQQFIQQQQYQLQQQQFKEQPQSELQQNQQPLIPLNYEAIKEFLLNSDESVKVCATLQAFRWRLTKTRRKKTLKQVIYTYQHYDLLDCNDKNDQRPRKIIDKLLLQSDRRVLEYTMTFINALGNECLGRSYLLQKGNLVETLVKILKEEQGDTHLRQNALGALQKFSLRRKPQTIMIQLDLIKWISSVLRNESDQLTDYSIEYATALLMNLSLRDAGKDKCEEPDIELLNVLNDLVEHENLQVRTYVNGTLYSIFTRKKLREEAKELGMPEVLQYLMDQSDEQFRRQIQYILEQLNSNNEVNQDGDNKDGAQSINANEGEEEIEDEDEDEEDDDDEEEMFDAEDAEFNDIIDEQGILVGEELLANQFAANPENAQDQMRKMATLMEKEQKQRINNPRNHSAIGGAMAGQSPYRVSVVSRNDGRPPTRPITPIKSAQQGRFPHNTASNTSQITNSAIGQQDDSQLTQQPPNLGLHQQQTSISKPFTGGEGSEDENRNLPSELRSRPKIPRTPAEGEGRENWGDQDMPQDQQTEINEIKIKGEVIKDGEKIKEHQEGFNVREKIVRTPPQEERKVYQGQANDAYMQQFYSQEGSLGQSPIPRRGLANSNSNQSLGYGGQQQQAPLLNQPPQALNQMYIYQQQQSQRASLPGGLNQAIQDSRIQQPKQGGQKGIQMEVRPKQRK